MNMKPDFLDAAGIQADESTIRLLEKAEAACRMQFEKIAETRLFNQAKILRAFREQHVSYAHLQGSTGYGYGDIGRDTLERVFAQVLGTEEAIVRPQVMSGTHALALAFSGMLRPGQKLVYISGKPYDTLEEVIGIRDSEGSLAEYGVLYGQVDLLSDGSFDKDGICAALRDPTVHVAAIQRSRGYAWRPSLTVESINDVIAFVRSIRPDVKVLVDNCYGEFVEKEEPRADILVGSLIKNPGGGIAPTGGYIAGTKDCVERVSYRLSAPGLGREIGSYVAGYSPFYQGLFLAPRTVADSLRVAVLASHLFADLGYDVLPEPQEPIRADIIQSIRFSSADRLVAFCQGVQAGAPIDAFVTPEPWEMPGYEHCVIMAAGTFVQGSSIEMSADAPLCEPYIAYLQGALTYDHGKLALVVALEELRKKNLLHI